MYVCQYSIIHPSVVGSINIFVIHFPRMTFNKKKIVLLEEDEDNVAVAVELQHTGQKPQEKVYPPTDDACVIQAPLSSTLNKDATDQPKNPVHVSSKKSNISADRYIAIASKCIASTLNVKGSVSDAPGSDLVVQNNDISKQEDALHEKIHSLGLETAFKFTTGKGCVNQFETLNAFKNVLSTLDSTQKMEAHQTIVSCKQKFEEHNMSEVYTECLSMFS